VQTTLTSFNHRMVEKLTDRPIYFAEIIVCLFTNVRSRKLDKRLNLFFNTQTVSGVDDISWRPMFHDHSPLVVVGW